MVGYGPHKLKLFHSMKYGKCRNAKKKKIIAKIFGRKVQRFKNYKINLKLAPQKIFFKSKSPNVGNFDRPLNSRGSRVAVALITSTAQSQAMMYSSVFF